MMFICAKCNEVQPERTPALIYHFKDEEEKEDFEKKMKPIKKFSKSGKFIIKKDHPQKGKWDVSLCERCWEEIK